MDEIDVIQAKLKAPFDEVHWRPKTFKNGKVLMLAYLDSRDVQDRLDDVFGIDGWSDSYEEIASNLYCSITAMGVTKSDCGTESNTDAEKGQASDAFKRSAVKWGIGRYLYKIEPLWLPIQEKGNQYVAIKDFQGQWHKGYVNILSKKEERKKQKERAIEWFNKIYEQYLNVNWKVDSKIDAKFESYNDSLNKVMPEVIAQYGKSIQKYIRENQATEELNNGL